MALVDTEIKQPLARPSSWPAWRTEKGATLAWVTAPEWICRWLVYWISDLALFKGLELAGKLAILVSLITYLSETGQRREERHNRAWSLIVASNGISGDGGRAAAVRSLYKDNVSLRGLPLSQATLSRLELPNAILDDAVFVRAQLRYPVLTGSSIQNANFSKSTLIGPNLTDANLLGADFTEAKMFWLADRNPLMKDAILYGASFRGAVIEPELPKDARYCQTVMPNGEIRNSDCTDQIVNILNRLREVRQLPE